MGMPTVGKTVMLGTSTLPLLIYSFDPKSTVVLWTHYPKLMKERWIVVKPFWDEGGNRNPKAYMEWEKTYENHRDTGFLERFATVSIDSYTGWILTAGNYWLHEKNKERSMKERGKLLDHLAQGDYPGLYDLSSTMVYELNSGSWHFLVTCHLRIVRNEETGVDERTELQVYKALKTEIPRLFSEKYVLTKKQVGPGEVKYILLTDVQGLYHIVGSQLRKKHGKNIKVEEEPNFRSLFRKAEKSYEDKPHWKTGKKLNADLLPDDLKEYI